MVRTPSGIARPGRLSWSLLLSLVVAPACEVSERSAEVGAAGTSGAAGAGAAGAAGTTGGSMGTAGNTAGGIDASTSFGEDASVDATVDATLDAPAGTATDARSFTDSSDAADAALPLASPYAWVGVIGTGQSLAVGGGPAINMTTSQPFKNLKLVDTGPDPKYPLDPAVTTARWAVTPLVEPMRRRGPGTGPGYMDGQYPNNIEAESPHSGMANTLSAVWAARGLGDYVSVHGNFGWSGHCLSDIDKAGGKRAYPASLNEARIWKMLAGQAGKTFGYGGIILTHGECDASNGTYANGLHQLWQDYNSDLKAVTGQSRDVVLFASQQSTTVAPNGGSAVAVWRAGMDHPGQIICTGPKYQYQYLADRLHLPAPGYERLGEKYAEVFDAVVNRRVAWQPLQPLRVSRAAAVLTVDFHVPNPPLLWDSHLGAPHTQKYTEWAAGRGFEVTTAQGARLPIAAVEIRGESVVITLAKDPGPGKVTVAYAVTQDGAGTQGGTPLGLHGQLRDSDEFVGWDVQDIESQVVQGSATVTAASPGGFIRRAGWDIVTGNGVPDDTIVAHHDTDSQLTLSAPWPGPTSKVTLRFRHDLRNYAVHFMMAEP
jgi:hypothetical protein